MAGIGDASIADLLKNLHLTAKEEAVAEFSDDENDNGGSSVEWALVGKVLSPSTVHSSAIFGAMKPAWGNPAGLKIRTIGMKGDNLFVAEFGFKQDMERGLSGSPWVVGKHAVILRDYEEDLKPSEITFDRMDIWVRIMDLPLGWMNRHRGERTMGLIGEVKMMDVDKDRKASGPFLRARVAIEVAKPLRRGVLLKTKRDGAPVWLDIQYEKLPFFCLSCGIMGHSQLECDKPVVRNEMGILPYDIQLRVFYPKKKKIQSFSEAAAETYGSGSSSASKQLRGSATRSGDDFAAEQKGMRADGEDEEVTSPQKSAPLASGKRDAPVSTTIGRKLFPARRDEAPKIPRKRKSKVSGSTSDQTPDLNEPVVDLPDLVPRGLVSTMVNQFVGDVDASQSARSKLSIGLSSFGESNPELYGIQRKINPMIGFLNSKVLRNAQGEVLAAKARAYTNIADVITGRSFGSKRCLNAGD
ncbi:hypothetical protein C2845_PM01G20240 [Panicum miliaceum]|uniref:CCHC-type domain-containing protein n=1 Tax=Panicum miliaceum TaxID=4540 RepID=A0A3L6TE77_PANMI|nr:hypothetical protein C2845_PM01G20240 [Panicum miliaceum]